MSWRRVPLVPLALMACSGSDVNVEVASDVEELRLQPSALVGEISEAEPEYLFGDVRSVAVDQHRNIYAGDRIGARVRAYSPAGRFIRTVAEEGEGPGEISGWPANLTFGPDGRLYIRDGSRITVFGIREGETVADSLVDVWSYSGYGNLTSSPSRVAGDGTYYYPSGGAARGGGPLRIFYRLFRDGEPTGDTLEVPSYPGLGRFRTAYIPLGPAGTGGRMVDGLDRPPFTPLPSWWITDRGTLLSADGMSPRLLETDLAGDTLRVIELDGVSSRSVSDQERQDSLRALEERIDSLPVTLDEVQNLGERILDRELADSVPTILSIREIRGGELWIERWPPAGEDQVRHYDVFDQEGRLLRRVVLEAPVTDDPPAYFGDEAIVGVILDSSTGVQRIVRFDFVASN